jgi:hypothetical protein
MKLDPYLALHTSIRPKLTKDLNIIVGSGVGEAYEDISTVVLSVLQAEFGTALATQ